ncbi:MAG: glycosyltransferase [Bacteroidales bacterium]
MTGKIQRICFVVPRAYYLFNPPSENYADKVGGAQKQTFLLSTGIAMNPGFDVHFIVADFGQDKLEIKSNVKVHKSFSFKQPIPLRLFYLLKSLKKVNADNYIFRAADAGVAVAALFIKIFLRKKVIYMLASDAETNFSQLHKMLGTLTALAMPLVYRMADKITVQTEQQYYLFLNSRKRKPDAVIYNIVNQIDNNKLNDNRHSVLWVGRLVKHKNPGIFIELAKFFPEQKFIMVAPVVNESSRFENEIITSTRQIKNLQLINFVSPDEINSYYSEALVYVITSESEGFSNTMAEAMAMGCAVLSYKVDNDFIISNYKLGFLADGNFENLKKGLRELLDNHELRKRCAENAVQYIKNFHYGPKIVAEFIKLLS